MVIHSYSLYVPQTCFGSYFQKGKIFMFGKESMFPIGMEESSPFRRHKIEILAVHVASVQCIKKCFFQWQQSYFEIFNWRFWKFTIIKLFFNSENLLSSIEQCMVPAFTFILPIREVSFRHSFTTRWWQIIMLLLFSAWNRFWY